MLHLGLKDDKVITWILRSISLGFLEKRGVGAGRKIILGKDFIILLIIFSQQYGIAELVQDES